MATKSTGINRDLIKCVAFGHWMDEDVEPANVRPIHVFQQYARCVRGCGTHRIQSLRADQYTVINSEYRYTDSDYDWYKKNFNKQSAKAWLLDHPEGGRRRRASSKAS